MSRLPALVAMATLTALSVAIPAVVAQDKGELRESACAKEKTAAEREVCLDKQLTRDDAYLNEVYQDLKKMINKADFKALRTEQLAWIKQRNRCGKTYQCIKDAYTDRIAEIEQEIENRANPNKSHVEIGCEGTHKFVDGECIKIEKDGGNRTSDAQAEMVWQANTISNPNTDTMQTAVLTYGVPETDNTLFQATCEAGITTTSAKTILGYGLPSGRNGADVGVQLVSGAYSIKLHGNLIGFGNTQEQLAGLLVKPRFNEAFWTVLARGVALTYSADGGDKVTLALTSRGSDRAVRKFLKHCVTLGAGTKNAAQAQKLTCTDWGKVQSDKPGAPVTMTFTNNSEGYRGVTWINAEGTPVDLGGLDVGSSYKAQTQAGHIWMFTDGPGNCIEMYAIQAGVTNFKITTPSPAFGPGND